MSVARHPIDAGEMRRVNRRTFLASLCAPLLGALGAATEPAGAVQTETVWIYSRRIGLR